jgi:hypothetical protein
MLKSTSIHKYFKPIYFSILLTLTISEALADDFNWSGTYVGVGVATQRAMLKSDYHQFRYTEEQTNLNFGSGYSDQGQADYTNKYSNSIQMTQLLISAAKLWNVGQYVIGAKGELAFGENSHENISEKLGYFGDNLKFSSSKGNNIQLSGIIGKPLNNFLPYLTAGISGTRINTNLYQMHIGGNGNPYFGNENAASKADTVIGFTVGAGIKWAMNDDWILSSEYGYTSYQNAQLNSNKYLPAAGGGIRYPTTQIDIDTNTSALNIFLEYKL